MPLPNCRKNFHLTDRLSLFTDAKRYAIPLLYISGNHAWHFGRIQTLHLPLTNAIVYIKFKKPWSIFLHWFELANRLNLLGSIVHLLESYR